MMFDLSGTVSKMFLEADAVKLLKHLSYLEWAMVASFKTQSGPQKASFLVCSFTMGT